ncbi:MAG: hypothetical protein K2X43_12665 [Hyphomonadaceae bacterium]|nr:hypothetical protein [Hyphomonadaceae bacterium]
MKYALLLTAAALLLTASAIAQQHKHGSKGPNGGQMEDVAGVHAELVISGKTLTIYIFDEAEKPVSAQGFAASALISAGASQETVMLSSSGQNVLKGEAKNPVPKGAAVAVTLKTAQGKSGQARFKQ